MSGVLDMDETAPGMKESASGRRETASSKDESASDVDGNGPAFSIDESAFAVCESPSGMQGSVCGVAEPSGMAELGSMVEPASSMVESASGMAEPGSMVKSDSGMDKLGNMVRSASGMAETAAGMDAADRSTEARESGVEETFPGMAVADSDEHKTSSVTGIFETEPDKDVAGVNNETDVAGSPAVAWGSESSKCPCSRCLVCLRVQAATASFTDGLSTAEVGLLTAEVGLSSTKGGLSTSCSPWSWSSFLLSSCPVVFSPTTVWSTSGSFDMTSDTQEAISLRCGIGQDGWKLIMINSLRRFLNLPVLGHSINYSVVLLVVLV